MPLKHFSRKRKVRGETDTREGFLKIGHAFYRIIRRVKRRVWEGIIGCGGREYADKFGVKWLPLP